MKRGGPWDQEEHAAFVLGLHIEGKGNWKAITSFVPTRSASQIASHAQKYFKRIEDARDQNSSRRRRKAVSILDTTTANLYRRKHLIGRGLAGAQGAQPKMATAAATTTTTATTTTAAEAEPAPLPAPDAPSTDISIHPDPETLPSDKKALLPMLRGWDGLPSWTVPTMAAVAPVLPPPSQELADVQVPVVLARGVHGSAIGTQRTKNVAPVVAPAPVRRSSRQTQKSARYKDHETSTGRRRKRSRGVHLEEPRPRVQPSQGDNLEHERKRRHLLGVADPVPVAPVAPVAPTPSTAPLAANPHTPTDATPHTPTDANPHTPTDATPHTPTAATTAATLA